MTKDDFLKYISWCVVDNGLQREQGFASRMQRFYVEDLTADENVSVILVCESPHTNEIQACYPLAGDSGKDVTATLARLVFGRSETWSQRMPYPWNQPIGKLVKDNHSCFDWLGIMNVCPVPLQESAYKRGRPRILPADIKVLSVHIEAIRTLKNNVKKDKEDAITQCMQSVILRSFRDRIESARGKFPNVTLIPCGKFAEAAFNKVGARADIKGIPHPSRKQWTRPFHQANSITEMSKKVRRRIEIASVAPVLEDNE